MKTLLIAGLFRDNLETNLNLIDIADLSRCAMFKGSKITLCGGGVYDYIPRQWTKAGPSCGACEKILLNLNLID